MVRGALERDGTFCKKFKFPNVGGASATKQWKLSSTAASKMTKGEYRAHVIARQEALTDKYEPQAKPNPSIYSPGRQSTPSLAKRQNVLVGYSRQFKCSMTKAKWKLRNYRQYTRRNRLKKIRYIKRVYKRVPAKRFIRKAPRTKFMAESQPSSKKMDS